MFEYIPFILLHLECKTFYSHSILLYSMKYTEHNKYFVRLKLSGQWLDCVNKQYGSIRHLIMSGSSLTWPNLIPTISWSVLEEKFFSTHSHNQVNGYSNPLLVCWLYQHLLYPYWPHTRPNGATVITQVQLLSYHPTPPPPLFERKRILLSDKPKSNRFRNVWIHILEIWLQNTHTARHTAWLRMKQELLKYSLTGLKTYVWLNLLVMLVLFCTDFEVLVNPNPSGAVVN